MSIKWTISHPDRLVTAALAGALEPGDVEGYLADVAAAGAMPYGKIIDLTFAPVELPLADLKAMMRASEQYAKGHALGPMAIVVDCDVTEEMSAFFGARTRLDRPFRIFRKMQEAEVWLAHPECRGDAAVVQVS